MINEKYKLSIILANYEELERMLEECLSFIPYINFNHQVFSPKFIPIIIEACGLIESIFSEYDNLKAKKGFKKFPNLVEPILELEETISVFLSTPLTFQSPFKNWTKKFLLGGSLTTS
jgi:hypothetical protein